MVDEEPIVNNLDTNNESTDKDVDTGSTDIKKEDAKETAEDNNMKLGKINPDLRIEVNDIFFGEKATARIYAHLLLDGIVYVYLSGVAKPEQVPVENGYGEVTFDESLYVGEYGATAVFRGDDDFDEGTATTTFNVKDNRLNPELKISVNDVRVGDNPTVEITASDDFSRTVYVYLTGSTFPEQVEVEDGYGELTFGELSAGKYTATVKYTGDDFFKEDEASTTFNVTEWDPDFPSYRDAYKYRGGFHKFVYDILRKMS